MPRVTKVHSPFALIADRVLKVVVAVWLSLIALLILKPNGLGFNLFQDRSVDEATGKQEEPKNIDVPGNRCDLPRSEFCELLNCGEVVPTKQTDVSPPILSACAIRPAKLPMASVPSHSVHLKM